MSPPSLVFKARRHEPELVSPAEPTPRLLLPLSDIDDQEFLRFQMSDLQFYRNHPSTYPVQVIRKALARALVFYYPFAGRLREGPGRKLSVDCTGEGVIFIEADADVALSDFGDFPRPPFPCLEELLFDVPGSDGIIGCPLLLIQIGIADVDFGWGKATYGGPPTSGVGSIPGQIVFFIACRNEKGEDGVVVPVGLPDETAMNSFEKALDSMLSAQISKSMKSSM